MTSPTSRLTRSVLVVLVGAALSGCIDENIVYKDKELFEQPPTAAASFLGYADHTAKLTVCGNCHDEKQAEWVETAHASAWAGLQDSGHAEDACEACHSVNALGNFVEGGAGFVTTGDARYEDVQCESCHGPGLEHASDPTDVNRPLAPLSVGLDLTTGCGECHQTNATPYLEEWSQSRHGRVNSFPAGIKGVCDRCHTGEAALAAWGIDGDYIEKAMLDEPGQHLAITCAVCHDPHGSDNDAQLRFPLGVASLDDQLCMKCHQRLGSPDPSSSQGPHSPEGPTLLGTAGWFPPSLRDQQRIVGSHGSPQANPKLCARCHVYSFDVKSGQTGETSFAATGHVFSAVPCTDAEGRPQAGGVCDDAQRTFAACTGSGCHASEPVVRSAKRVLEARIDRLADELNALVREVPSTEFLSGDGVYTTGEGAKFNVLLARRRGAAVHNPFLLESLLVASIDEVNRVYGLAPSTEVAPDAAGEGK